MGAITSLLIGVAALGGTMMAMKSMNKSTPAPQPQPLPEAPKVEDSQKQAQEAVMAKRRAMARQKSIYTSPLGIGGEANVARKQLLGQ